MRTAFADFQQSLNRIRDITINIDTETAVALKHTAILYRHQTIQCAVTVILAGFFESFLRDVAEAYIGELCEKYRPFSALPLIVQRTHFLRGGAVLQRRAQTEKSGNPHWITASSSDIARRLASVNADPPYDLLWEAFADSRHNPGPETVKELLKNCGVAEPANSLAGETGLSDPTFVSALRSFMFVRHECAHAGIPANVPTPDDIRGYCDLIEKIATAIVRILEAQP